MILGRMANLCWHGTEKCISWIFKFYMDVSIYGEGRGRNILNVSNILGEEEVRGEDFFEREGRNLEYNLLY